MLRYHARSYRNDEPLKVSHDITAYDSVAISDDDNPRSATQLLSHYVSLRD